MTYLKPRSSKNEEYVLWPIATRNGVKNSHLLFPNPNCLYWNMTELRVFKGIVTVGLWGKQ